MNFKRKDIKKSSYYVWFLGAKEAEGLRGDEFVLPVLRYLTDQEGLSEVSKVTLQVSNKGLKIIQNVPKKSSSSCNPLPASNLSSAKLSLSSNSGKTEQIKHLIPHNAITCVVQEDDLVACILLIYNPITKCPVHVHAYRCDSIETASSLRGQLQLLIEKPENQRKFKEIESRLVSKGLTVNQQPHQLHQHLKQQPQSKPTESSVELNRRFNPLGKRGSSESRSIRTESSDRTEDSYDSGLINGSKENKSLPIELALGNPKVAILYESLAAELKAKLSNPKSGPILLPPKDYDTISRKQGKLSGIEARKSTNMTIVGPLETPSTTTNSSSSSSPTTASSSPLKGIKDKKTGLIVGSSLSTSSSSSSSSSVLKKAMVLPSATSTSNLHIIRSESSCKSSSGIGSDEPDKLSSSSTSPFNRELIKATANYRCDVSSDDSERNWSPIESGPSSSGSAASSGRRLLNLTTTTSTSNMNNNSSNHIVNNKMMITNNANNSNKNIHHHHSHHHNINNNINNNNNRINNKKHEIAERLETNRLNNSIKSSHHQLTSSSSSSSSSSSLSTTNRASIPPPVVPKASLMTKPMKTDLKRIKNDLRPVITGVTPHSASPTINSSNNINSNNNINYDNNKGKVDPPRYYFPDQIVSNNSNVGLMKNKSSDNHHSRRLPTHNLHHDYPSDSVKPSAGDIINITNACARLKPTRDFIRVQPLTNYQRSPISY
ncbi:bromodomain-containing protein DDB_G0270170-like [Tetranychus urticae]|uniref:bromodomain-containing protein DDB_G0270170-like n=1 Tax=Tetranychus urticae TaxID=32264 RepID=UPI00077C0B48|nr:bromodomain-containing protein DDB_G0270170-like [Tetranychus urticae]XP_015795425.1 bromodomain-containing protein DDB_G0270170-like [Tetranychus urticae]XP_025018507.1 bromodomain-containing protein DDB_G0270170-like [Tetranychus urticae]XP_025018508.1 bromodomain-containing protein DDB_G0270170-like [Tetranychus urticae]